MSSNYFTYFPKVTYRVKILEQLNSEPLGYLAYTIKEGERAEDIAYYYYDDIGKVWLVYMANNIVDPYSQWPLNQTEFEKYLIAKYKTQSASVGYNVINWTRNATITTNIVHYENLADSTLKISKDTYLLNANLGLIEASEWKPVRYYDYEVQLNEDKRHIFLVNRIYADQMENELESLMNAQ
jgi:hypothetical protein